MPRTPQKAPAMVIWEVSRFAPGTTATPAQVRAAALLVQRCYRAAEQNRWYDYEKGLADGYWLSENENRHYRKTEFLKDEHVLDPDRPEFLMYYPTEDGRELVGFMFVGRARTERGPQVGGPLTVWHFHVWNRMQCAVDGVVPLGFAPRGAPCERGRGYHRSLEMMHVWLVDRREGPFATSMVLAREAVATGLAKRRRERGW